MKLLNRLLILGMFLNSTSLKGQDLISSGADLKACSIECFSICFNTDRAIPFSETMTFAAVLSSVNSDSTKPKKIGMFERSTLLKRNCNPKVSFALENPKSGELNPVLHYNKKPISKEEKLKIGSLNASITNWVSIDPTTIMETNCGMSIEAQKLRPNINLLFYYTLSGDPIEPITYHLELVLSTTF